MLVYHVLERKSNDKKGSHTPFAHHFGSVRTLKQQIWTNLSDQRRICSNSAIEKIRVPNIKNYNFLFSLQNVVALMSKSNTLRHPPCNRSHSKKCIQHNPFSVYILHFPKITFARRMFSITDTPNGHLFSHCPQAIQSIAVVPSAS